MASRTAGWGLAAIANWRRGTRPIAIGLITFAVVWLIDAAFSRFGLHAEATILDDLLLGALAGLYVAAEEARHHRDLRAQEEKLKVVMEMNHHIRNALQAIIYVNAQNPDQDSARKVAEAAQRITWALEEVLTGKGAGEQTQPAISFAPVSRRQHNA